MPKIFGVFCFKRKFLMVITASMLAVLLSSGAFYVHAANNLKPIYEVKTDQKIVALTFDISWGSAVPAPVLDILKENNIKATFFLSGPWVKQYPDVPVRIKEEGHEIGSHGYRHINYSNLSKTEIKEEIMKAHKNIHEVTGVEANLIRMPNGDYNNQVILAAQECNYNAVQWSIDSLDWMNPGVDNIVQRVNKKLHPGGIILMHASDTCKQTTTALPAVLKNIQDQGYQIVTVSELLNINSAPAPNVQ